MCREFEIRFTDRHGGEIQPDGYTTLEFVYPDRKPEDYLTGNHYMLDDFYIHPDSLDIFKPKVGDRNCDGWEFSGDGWRKVIRINGVIHVAHSQKQPIEKRNGKQFFTPKEG